MDVVIGVNPDGAGRDAVALGAVASRLAGDSPVLAYVHLPTYDYPSRGNVDAEWEAYVAEQAHAVLAEAAEVLAGLGMPDARTTTHAHRSSGAGLAEIAERLGARYIVIGSAPDGSTGRISPGSTADQLLHGSPVPVLLAPHGYRRLAPERFGRVVVAYQRTAESDRALDSAAALARDTVLPLHVVTVVLRTTRLFGTRLSGDPEQQVIAVQVAEAARDQAAAAQRLADLDVTHEVVVGESALSALSRVAWHDDDVLVLGSASGGPIRRVFLGDMTYRLLRAAPVPVLVLPRHA